VIWPCFHRPTAYGPSTQCRVRACQFRNAKSKSATAVFIEKNILLNIKIHLSKCGTPLQGPHIRDHCTILAMHFYCWGYLTRCHSGNFVSIFFYVVVSNDHSFITLPHWPRFELGHSYSSWVFTENPECLSTYVLCRSQIEEINSLQWSHN